MASQRFQDAVWKKKHVAGVAAATAVTSVTQTGAILGRIVVANANAGVQTLTLVDGSESHVIQVPAKDTVSLEYNATWAASITVTPSSVDIDAMIIFQGPAA